MKKKLILILTLVLLLFNAGCSVNNVFLNDNAEFSVSMAADLGGVNDMSFNKSAWEGLKKFRDETSSKVSYIESQQASDYFTNLDKLSDENINLIWGIGFTMADAVKWASKINPELNYSIVDYSFGDDTPDNITGVLFRDEESAFVVGYIAGKTTKTNIVGFVGGIKGMVIDRFEYGFRAGVVHAALELGTKIDVKVQYAECFNDPAKGKAIALKMFSDSCDIIFHAAGGVGIGVIEAAKETNNFAIGADMDQSYLAPKNVLTSAIKNTGQAVNLVSKMAMNKEKIGGKTFFFGLKENCVGLPENNPNLSQNVYNDALKIINKITNETIKPPFDETTFKNFIKHGVKF